MSSLTHTTDLAPDKQNITHAVLVIEPGGCLGIDYLYRDATEAARCAAACNATGARARLLVLTPPLVAERDADLWPVIVGSQIRTFACIEEAFQASHGSEGQKALALSLPIRKGMPVQLGVPQLAEAAPP